MPEKMEKADTMPRADPARAKKLDNLTDVAYIGCCSIKQPRWFPFFQEAAYVRIGKHLPDTAGCEAYIWAFYLDSEKGKPPERTGRKATDLKLGIGLWCVGCRARIAGLPTSGL